MYHKLWSFHLASCSPSLHATRCFPLSNGAFLRAPPPSPLASPNNATGKDGVSCQILGITVVCLLACPSLFSLCSLQGFLPPSSPVQDRNRYRYRISILLEREERKEGSAHDVHHLQDQGIPFCYASVRKEGTAYLLTCPWVAI